MHIPNKTPAIVVLADVAFIHDANAAPDRTVWSGCTTQVMCSTLSVVREDSGVYLITVKARDDGREFTVTHEGECAVWWMPSSKLEGLDENDG